MSTRPDRLGEAALQTTLMAVYGSLVLTRMGLAITAAAAARAGLP